MKNTNTRKPVVDHIARTITVTNTFMRAAADPTSPEYEMYLKLVSSCPNYKVVVAKKQKVKKDDKQAKLTYAKMGDYIACLRNSDELLAVFEKVKAFAKTQPNPYLTVSRWFNASFPDYGCQPDFDADGFPLVEANCVSLEAYMQQNEAVKQQGQNTIEQLGA